MTPALEPQPSNLVGGDAERERYRRADVLQVVLRVRAAVVGASPGEMSAAAHMPVPGAGAAHRGSSS